MLGWNATGDLTDAINILFTADPIDIVRAQANVLLPEDKLKGIRHLYGPVVEDAAFKAAAFISTEPRLLARNSWSKKIPVILGSTSDEALLLNKWASEQGSNLLQSINFVDLIPYDIGRTLTDRESINIAAQIKSVYFQNESATQKGVLKDYIQMQTDRLYGHGMYRMALARLQENKTNPTYLYRFGMDSPTFNHMRIAKCGTLCRGACHGDDLSYIFRDNVDSVGDVGVDEFKVITSMINIFFEFASRNNPNSDDSNFWIPLNEQSGNFKCFNITPMPSYIQLPELEKMKFWSSLYVKDFLI